MADTRFIVKPLGDGLYTIGKGDIYCTYPLQGTKIDIPNKRIVYDYKPYIITVTWEGSDDGTNRKNPKWQRTYK